MSSAGNKASANATTDISEAVRQTQIEAPIIFCIWQNDFELDSPLFSWLQESNIM
jgi:hypothetical protein